MKRQSTFGLIGLPEKLAVKIAIFFFTLLLSPYLGDTDFGVFKIPRFPNEMKSIFMWLGPILFFLWIALFIPLWKRTKEFKDEVQGSWWQLVLERPGEAVSFMHIRYSNQTHQFQLMANTYNSKGKEVARWRSTGSGFNTATLELIYFWRGDEYKKANTVMSGVGYFQFSKTKENKGLLSRAVGWFTSGKLNELKVTGKEKVELNRSLSSESKIMKSSDIGAQSQLIASKYAEWIKKFQN